MRRAIGRRLTYLWARLRPLPRNRVRHGLPARLVVSLTSHRARFGTLAATLRGLLAQTVAPDLLILWIGHDDWSNVPGNIRDLQEYGLTLRATDDIGPYTKIIPTLISFPDAFIATADDDRHYEPSWLESLVAGYRGDRREIVCCRVHKIILDENGRPLPYLQWAMETDCRQRSKLLFPTGLGGVLFPPGCFHEDVVRREIFTELAPTADDLWLYWMARLNNCSFRKVGVCRRLHQWPSSQRHTLWSKNKMPDSGNDAQIDRLASRYGWPFD